LEAAVVALLSLLLLLVEPLHQLPKWVPLHWELMVTVVYCAANDSHGDDCEAAVLALLLLLVVVMGSTAAAPGDGGGVDVRCCRRH
jgi:hypothetical protein